MKNTEQKKQNMANGKLKRVPVPFEIAIQKNTIVFAGIDRSIKTLNLERHRDIRGLL
jgi:hypothetical protein